MMDYKRLKVVIIGLGETGISCVNFFLKKGVIPKVTDIHLFPLGYNRLPNFVQCSFGSLNDVWILEATLIVISPGIRLDYPVLIEAMKIGIEIIGDIELFAREVTTPIVAITGSNGKSTVTQLLGNIAQYAGLHVGVAGNIGIPALTLLNKSYQLYVLELSSFQLDTTYSLFPVVAIVLNISEDHIDRYPGGLQQYCLSKEKIYDNATTCIINISNLLTAPMFYRYKNSISFGFNEDYADYNLTYYKGNIWIVAYNEYLLNCSDMLVSSYVNYINALSVLALSDVINIPRSISFQLLCQFYGLPHRCQLVYKKHGVSWINDSKATNVDATKHAIKNVITLVSGSLHLLLGGYSKLADFSSLKNLFRVYGNICLYCFGKDGLFLTELSVSGVILTNTMVQSMFIISRRIKKGDVVLLSPACSSIDQFKSFKIRGLIFNYFSKEFGQ